MSSWLSWFLFTQSVEVPIYAWPLHGRVTIAFAASAITHPIVWFLFPVIVGGWWPMVVCSELFAVAAEAFWLRAFGVRRALLWSSLANGASFGLGLVSHFALRVP